VVAEGMTRRSPQPQDLDVVGFVFHPFRVDEAVCRRNPVRTEGLDDASNDIASAHARRERAVHRQIVEGQRHRVPEPRAPIADRRAPCPQ
jgi:hypothetical protein